MAEAFMMLGAAFSLVTLLMIILWVVSLFQRNAGLVDIGWALSFLIVAWAYFFLGGGDFLKMIIMTAMVTIWAGRLLSHLYLRYQSSLEDPRYTRLREKWGGDPTGALFLMMFIFQGILAVLLSLPFFLVAFGSSSEWSKWEFIGIFLWLIGVLGESAADRQLAAFKKNPENAEKVCRTGLWRFCRHPNYFFEWVVWLGFFFFALSSYGGAFAAASPALMFFLLTRVSGVPLAEEEALAPKGEAYRDYQRTTSTFFPWLPG